MAQQAHKDHKARQAHQAWVVSSSDVGTRLDVLVAGADIGLSRSQSRQLIANGQITVGGQPRKPGYLVRTDDRIVVEGRPAVAPVRAEAEDLPLDALYEDEVLVAINKAPGMVVHPAPGRWHGTLVNALLHRWGRLPADETERPGIVHRLDRDTSGVIVVARTQQALEHLARQFQRRTVAKRYLAIVRGIVRQDEFVIDAVVGRHPTDRKRMSTRTRRGRDAVTRVVVRERFRHATLVEAQPKTGRTHQIRVHLAARGHPVVGDRVYGRSRVARSVDLGRQALHAASLAVDHPTGGERVTIEAPLWPDMVSLLTRLRAEAGG